MCTPTAEQEPASPECRTRRPLFASLILSFGLALAQQAMGEIAFQQAPVDGNDAFSSISAAQSGDDFALSSDALVNALSWWGAYADDPANLAADSFRVRLFEDDGSGLPKTAPFVEFNQSPVRTATALTDVTGATVYRFELAPPSPLALSGGKPYYISIVNLFDIADPNADWYWLLSDTTGTNFYRFASTDPWQADVTGNLAFALHTAAVPEPGTCAMVLAGGGLLVAVTRRRRKSV